MAKALRYALVVRKSDGAVVGRWRGKTEEGVIPVPDPSAPKAVREVTEAQFLIVVDNGYVHEGGGEAKYTLDEDGNPVLRSDPRPVGTFTATDVEAAVGAPSPRVGVRHISDPSYSGPLLVCWNGIPIELTFAAGVAPLDINTDEPTEYSVSSCEHIRMTNALAVTIKASTLRSQVR